jgi:hypoxanthine phosphoribosyltransferase
MKVVTLADEQFILTCKELSREIKDSFTPDIIISVMTGGIYVGRQILKALDDKHIYCAEILIQRSHTKKKEIKWVHFIIKRIPKFIADWIRISESTILYVKSKFKKPLRVGKLQFEENIEVLLKYGEKKVLLVDDSIDSGATMEFLHSQLVKYYPHNTYKIAVIAVTTNNPLIDADFYIYHNWTQARFPWSHDA